MLRDDEAWNEDIVRRGAGAPGRSSVAAAPRVRFCACASGLLRHADHAFEAPRSEIVRPDEEAGATAVGHPVETYPVIPLLEKSGQAGRMRLQPEMRSQGFAWTDTEVDMSPDWIIGALALITIGGVLGLSIFHFGVHLRDPKNLEAAKRVAADRASAMTRMSSESVNGRSLRQRLDEAPALNERLGSRKMQSVGLWSLLFDMNWSTLRSSLRLPQK